MLRRRFSSHREPVRAPNGLIDRRRFITWIGGVAVLTACSRNPLGVPAVEGSLLKRTPISRSGVVNDVRDSGAIGDGVTDDTTAFQTAVAMLGPAGGTLYVPPGTYLIDPKRSVQLTDNVTLLLDDAAILKAKPVTAGYSAVVLVSEAKNVSVIGGTIIGERYGHLVTTGEDGFGIWIRGASQVRIDSVHVQDCWGDGILIGGYRVVAESRDVTITKCVSRNNRRQGLSVLALFGGLVEDSEFSGTNGTAPESGIDVEPNGKLRVDGLTIRNCTMTGNAGPGLLLCGPVVPGATPAVSNIHVESIYSADNGLDGVCLLRGVTLSTITGSRFERNQNNGVQLIGSSQNEIVSNSFRDNGLASPPLYASVRLTDGSSDNTVSNNTYLPAGALPDVALITPDCVNNRVA